MCLYNINCTSDPPTAHQQATSMAAHSLNHSWQEVYFFNLTRLKYFMKLQDQDSSSIPHKQAIAQTTVRLTC